MSDVITCQVNSFDFSSSDQDAVNFDIDVSVEERGNATVFLYAAVGAEDPILVAKASSGNLVAEEISIEKTRGLLDGGRGNKPIALTVYACWVYDNTQALNFIAANAAMASKASTIHLAA